jgi:hypothetical protein
VIAAVRKGWDGERGAHGGSSCMVDDQAGSAPKDEESLMKERGERAYRM